MYTVIECLVECLNCALVPNQSAGGLQHLAAVDRWLAGVWPVFKRTKRVIGVIIHTSKADMGLFAAFLEAQQPYRAVHQPSDILQKNLWVFLVRPANGTIKSLCYF